MNKFLKFLVSIVLFLILFYVYAIGISLITMLPIGLIMGWESPGWVLVLAIAYPFSLFLSFITVRKLIYPRNFCNS